MFKRDDKIVLSKPFRDDENIVLTHSSSGNFICTPIGTIAQVVEVMDDGMLEIRVGRFFYYIAAARCELA